MLFSHAGVALKRTAAQRRVKRDGAAHCSPLIQRPFPTLSARPPNNREGNRQHPPRLVPGGSVALLRLRWREPAMTEVIAPFYLVWVSLWVLPQLSRARLRAELGLARCGHGNNVARLSLARTTDQVPQHQHQDLQPITNYRMRTSFIALGMPLVQILRR